MAEFEFVRHLDGTFGFEDAILQAIGAASMCWEHPERAGVFLSHEAIEIAEALMRELVYGPR